MSKQTDNLIQEIFSGKNTPYFLIGWIVLGVLGNAVFSIVTKFIESNVTANQYAVWFATFSIALVLLWVIIAQLKKRLYRQTTKLLVKQTHPEKHKALIVLVSRLEPSRMAIYWHLDTLENCWLICSESSRKVADELKKEFDEKLIVEILEVADEKIYEPMIFKGEVDNIFERLPKNLKREDVILDFTGMTVTASVGSLLAFIGSERTIQYTPAVNTAMLEEVGSHQPIQIKLDLKISNS